MIEKLFETHSDSVDYDNLRKLGLFIEGNVDIGLLAALVQFAGVKLPEDERRFLVGPFVVHQGGNRYHRTEAPDWLFGLGRLERYEIVVEKKPGIVGPAEMTAVMYEATMQAPLRAELTRLYLWASVNACVRHYGRDRAEMWRMLDMKPIEDQDVIADGGELWREYRTLSEAIRRKVVLAQKEREDEDRIERQRQARAAAAQERFRRENEAAANKGKKKQKPEVDQMRII